MKINITKRVLCLKICFLAAIAMAVVFNTPQSYAGQKTLIIYFSKTGNTKAACELLQKALGADMIEVKDLSQGELKLDELPAIEPKSIDLSKYSSIILASPIWAGQIAPAAKAVLNNNSFTGKKVALFTTTNMLIEDQMCEKSRELVRKAGGMAVGYYQINVQDKVNDKRVPRSKEQILADTQKIVPELKKVL
jgi:flavodoxin